MQENVQSKTDQPPHGAVILTPGDVERLLTDSSEDSRLHVLEKVSGHYNEVAFAPREHEIAEQIFRLLMKDAAIRVRERLAERVKDNDSIPRDIVLHLAHDVESVALPVLADSKVFSDADLVSIVEASRDISKLMTISRREQVSSRISDALVETRYPEVVSSLIANEGAVIDSRAFEKIIDDFRGEPAVMEAMVERNALPTDIIERMVNEASSAVAEQLKKKYKIDDSQLKRETGGAREDVLLKLLKRRMDDPELAQLVRSMAASERLTASLAMTALCRGQLDFFTAAMAHFSGIGIANARRLINDKGELGFHGIYSKSGLPETMYPAVRLLLRAVQQLEGDEAVPGSLLYANRLVERLLALAGHEPVEYLPYFIALIRQNIARH